MLAPVAVGVPGSALCTVDGGWQDQWRPCWPPPVRCQFSQRSGRARTAPRATGLVTSHHAPTPTQSYSIYSENFQLSKLTGPVLNLSS